MPLSQLHLPLLQLLRDLPWKLHFPLGLSLHFMQHLLQRSNHHWYDAAGGLGGHRLWRHSLLCDTAFRYLLLLPPQEGLGELAAEQDERRHLRWLEAGNHGHRAADQPGANQHEPHSQPPGPAITLNRLKAQVAAPVLAALRPISAQLQPAHPAAQSGQQLRTQSVIYLLRLVP